MVKFLANHRLTFVSDGLCSLWSNHRDSHLPYLSRRNGKLYRLGWTGKIQSEQSAIERSGRTSKACILGLMGEERNVFPCRCPRLANWNDIRAAIGLRRAASFRHNGRDGAQGGGECLGKVIWHWALERDHRLQVATSSYVYRMEAGNN